MAPPPPMGRSAALVRISHFGRGYVDCGAGPEADGGAMGFAGRRRRGGTYLTRAGGCFGLAGAGACFGSPGAPMTAPISLPLSNTLPSRSRVSR